MIRVSGGLACASERASGGAEAGHGGGERARVTRCVTHETHFYAESRGSVLIAASELEPCVMDDKGKSKLKQ